MVAFDGLDYELIKQFDLENIQQEEFGKIDNQKNISAVMTSELFAGFLTGETHESHNVTGVHYYQKDWRGRILELLDEYGLPENVRGFLTLKQVLKDVLKVNEIRYSKEDIKLPTLFEEIENSRPMFVPSYNPDLFWETYCETQPLKYRYGKQIYLSFWKNRVFEHRKRMFFSELENDIIGARSLLMCHFHYVDQIQDMNKDRCVRGDYEDQLKSVYGKFDQLAGNIKEKALDRGYDSVIFMSDHGRPKESEHNENAFYSCNKELFGEETPHITDFHDKIIELTKEKKFQP